MDVPPCQWALTIAQLKELVGYCRSLPEWRSDITMREFVEEFIVPWSEGTGSSYALLRNASQPLTAKVMVSHTWREQVEEFSNTLFRSFEIRGTPDDTPLFICSFALYQCGDRHGPTITEQISLDPEPFVQVIQSTSIQEMVAVHVRQDDLYSRLWCVRELDEAKKLGIPIIGAMPLKADSSYTDVRNEIFAPFVGPGLFVNTKAATCSRADDELRIRQDIEGVDEPTGESAAYRKLDKRITDIRLKMYVDAFLWYSSQSLGFSLLDNKDRLRLLRRIAARALRTAPETKEDAIRMFAAIESAIFAVGSSMRVSVDVVQVTAKVGASYVKRQRAQKLRRVQQIRDIATLSLAARGGPPTVCCHAVCGSRRSRASSPKSRTLYSEPALPADLVGRPG
jgi:hypothetical protein